MLWMSKRLLLLVVECQLAHEFEMTARTILPGKSSFRDKSFGDEELEGVELASPDVHQIQIYFADSMAHGGDLRDAPCRHKGLLAIREGMYIKCHTSTESLTSLSESVVR